MHPTVRCDGSLDLAVVIMAGGIGTRLFPASSPLQPKQFVKWPAAAGHPTGDEREAEAPRSLLQETYNRLLPLSSPSRMFVVAPGHFFDAVKGDLPDIPADNIIIEPCRRSSAGACALATARIARLLGPNTVIVFVPSDAWVAEDKAYRAAVQMAAEAADKQNGIVVVGIRPTGPSTGYGYIQPGPLLEHGAYTVSRFVEKPNRERAEILLEEGCLWNAGIFVWPAHVARRAFEDLLPQHGRLFEEGLSTDDETQIFESLPSVSVDVGVAEHAHNVFCVAGHFAWDDLGTWDAFGRVFPTDASGNVALGQARFVDSQGCVAVAEGGKIVALGVSDLVVVRFGDTVLVCPRDRSQDVGKLAE